MREFKPAHSDQELRSLISKGLAVADEVTLETARVNGMQLARLVREFGCDFDFSRDYEHVTLRRIVTSAESEAA